MTLRTCNKCGWVHMGISREHAEAAIDTFNKFFDTLTDTQKEDYYGSKKSSINEYSWCHRCGNTYKDFRESREGDCGLGVTIGPILVESV